MNEIKPKRLLAILAHPDDESFAIGRTLAKYAHQDVQVILTFGPDGVSGHSDHVTISHIVTRVYDQFYNKGLLLYIHPSEATVLGCGVSFSNKEDGKPLVEVDISDYKLEKVRAIQCHASQSPGLPGRPEEEMDKIPCSELYTIARDGKAAQEYPDWFEPLRNETGIAANHGISSAKYQKQIILEAN
jgi:LmbE family N-acetylglucosaminyl deacetylase